MSLDATKWAWAVPLREVRLLEGQYRDQIVGRAPQRLVLLRYADRADGRVLPLVAWSSVATLSYDTGLDERTVEKARLALRQERYLVDTGQRRGPTGRATVYRLDLSNTGSNEGIHPPNNAGITTAPIPPIVQTNPPNDEGAEPPINEGRIVFQSPHGTDSAPSAEEPAPLADREDTESVRPSAHSTAIADEQLAQQRAWDQKSDELKPVLDRLRNELPPNLASLLPKTP